MSLPPKMLETLRRLGRELRGERVEPLEALPIFEVPIFKVPLFMRLDYTYCRVWLYQACVFLPARLMGMPFSALKGDPMMIQLLEICRRQSLKKPTHRPDNMIAHDAPWEAEDVSACLQALLFRREKVCCIKKRFTLRLVQHDPAGMAITEE